MGRFESLRKRQGWVGRAKACRGTAGRVEGTNGSPNQQQSAGRGEESPGLAWQGSAWAPTERESTNQSRQGKARRGKACPGLASRGLPWSANQSEAWLGKARPVVAWRGAARLVEAAYGRQITRNLVVVGLGGPGLVQARYVKATTGRRGKRDELD